MRIPVTAAIAVLLCMAAVPSQADNLPDPYPSTYQRIAEGPVLIEHATVLTGTGERLEDSDVLIENGTIKVTPERKKGTLDDFINALPRSERSFTVEEMNEAIAQAACDGGC